MVIGLVFLRMVFLFLHCMARSSLLLSWSFLACLSLFVLQMKLSIFIIEECLDMAEKFMYEIVMLP